MDKQQINQKVRAIDLKAKSNKEFFLIHGYTGSSTDFFKLPEYLHKKFNANVKVILLKGHGTSICDLDNVSLKDLVAQLESELEKDLKKGRKIIIGGYSLGGVLSLYLASKYPVSGCFNIVAPIKINPYGYIPGLSLLGIFRRYWPKFIPQAEISLRQNAFYYSEMHINGLKILKGSIRLVKRNLKNISCPCLSIHAKEDAISSYKSIYFTNNRIQSKDKLGVVFNTKQHDLFFSDSYPTMEKIIWDFFVERDVFKERKELWRSVSAIVPAYNEGTRIKNVLEVLAKTKIINEVIVVDDGSSDDTGEIVKKMEKEYPKIKYLKNNVNKGKAYSMDRGVKYSRSNVIFFCDSDLNGLTSKIVEQIIFPVLNNEYDMFIGIRGNLMQKVFTPFALNSGERALHKETWESLPAFYKNRYRIEVGLNYFVKLFGRGFGYKQFSHFQTLKEVKYGFWRGTFLRWWMNLDVVLAFLRMNLYDRFAIKRPYADYTFI